MTHQSIQEQMERIVVAGVFSRSGRLATFLRFVVEETIAGRGDTLKEQVIAAALYPQNGDEDDSVVRADARRVRDKLREYYAEATADPVIISLPKGTYTPVFTARPEAAEAQPASPSKSLPRVWLGIAAVLILVAGVAIAWRIARPSPAPPRILPLTQFPGGESDPTFSPDGNFVAFAWWSPPGPSPHHIWIKDISGEGLRRLTDTAPPVSEQSPAWSPNGREIAFERVGWQGQPIPNAGIYVSSVLGGPERRVSESGRNPRWTPDGKSLLLSDGRAIVEIELATQHRRTVTQSAEGRGIGKFDLSPDGTTVAFIYSKRVGVSDIYLVPRSGGQSRQLTDWGALTEGVAWTSDSQEIIYDVTGQSIWRIPVRGNTPGRGTPVTGLEGFITPASRALKPVISPPSSGNPTRLGFQVQKATVNLRLVDLESVSSDGELRAQTLVNSSRVDLPGPFSGDGEKIAFYSDWAGLSAPLWVLNRDGSNLRQLIRFATPLLRPGAWSPDGRFIVFDSAVSGNSDIYLISESGGEAKRLTNDRATDRSPSWSRDGRWIYYESNKTGKDEVWKMTPEGGGSTQVTREGGADPVESDDAAYLLFLEPDRSETSLAQTYRLKLLRAGAVEAKLLPITVRRRLWGVTKNGVIFLTAEKGMDAIDLFALPEGPVTRVGHVPFLTPRQFPGMTFSRDGRWALTNQIDRRESDLMMIENFK